VRAADRATLATAENSVRTVRATAAALCIFGAAVLIREFYRAVVVFPGAALLDLALELPLLVVGWWLLRLLRPVRSPSRLWSGAAVIWGATAATGCALLANQGLSALWARGAGIGFASNWSAALSAPLNEEILKLCGVVMIVLAAPRAIRGPLDGMVYGALTGLGFQVTENIFYGLNNVIESGDIDSAHAVASSAAVRVGVTALGSHWTMTAIGGAGIGCLAARGLRRGALPAVASLTAAMAMHLLFDAPQPAILVKVAINFAAAASLYLILRRGYQDRARSALVARTSSDDITDAQAAVLLSRHERRRELRRVPPGTERDRIAARQQAVLAEVEDEAA
jgi:RsiW-degrading membrane proteinase PrsW (M82 family)